MHLVTKSGRIFWEACQVFFEKNKKREEKAKMLQKTEVKKYFCSNKKVREFKGFEFPRGFTFYRMRM